MDIGSLTKGESVLIQSAIGGVGLAAIQVARICDAEIYTTVRTAEKKAKLLVMDLGIKETTFLDRARLVQLQLFSNS